RRDGLRAHAGAAAQPGEGLERKGARPHRAHSGDLRTPCPHPRGHAAGRARAPDLSAQPSGALVDAPRAPARRLRLHGRPRRGAGEAQTEPGGGLIPEGMVRLGRERGGVRRPGALHGGSRKRVPYPIVALVGYTNAGKSTLFNRLTAARVLSADMLFATLDPT